MLQNHIMHVELKCLLDILQSIHTRQNSNGVRPSDRPTVLPSVRPTVRPTVRPSVRPTVHPSDRPSVRPTA